MKWTRAFPVLFCAQACTSACTSNGGPQSTATDAATSDAAPQATDARAQAPDAAQLLPLFDVHVHFSNDVTEAQQELSALQARGGAGLFALGAASKNTDIVTAANYTYPFVIVNQPYSDATAQTVTDQLKAGKRGVGEFILRHPNAPATAADSSVPLAVFDAAAAHAAKGGVGKVPVTIHFDAENHDTHQDLYSAELDHALTLKPNTTIIWAHLGDSDAALVRKLITAHSNLYADISCRNNVLPAYNRSFPTDWQSLTDSTGKLTEEWRTLFEDFPDRFLYGSDFLRETTSDRFSQMDDVLAYYRSVFAQLKTETAEKIAYRNAKTLLGL